MAPTKGSNNTKKAAAPKKEVAKPAAKPAPKAAAKKETAKPAAKAAAKPAPKAAAKPAAKAAAKKETAKPAPKAAAKKAAPKNAKSESDKTAAKRRTYHDSLVVFYGGCLKPGHSCISLVKGTTKKNDIMAHVFEEFTGYYGNTLHGCYVKCENGDEALEAFKSARSEESLIEGTDFMYSMSATEAKNAAKEAAGIDSANQFKLEDYEEGAKEEGEDGEDAEDAEDADADAEEDAEDAEDAEDGEEDDEEVDEENADEEENDEDEEDADEEPAPKQKAAQKGKATARRR